VQAIPYCGPAPEPERILAAWNLDPILIAALVALGWALRHQPARVLGGFGLLALAYLSPLCSLSAGLFSARAVHHLVIVFGAAPLLAGALRWRRVPLVPAFALHLCVFWLWHLPAAYEWALASDPAYWSGQLALLGSSMLLWRALSRPDLPVHSAFFALIATVMQMGLLGALLTFAPRAFYSAHFLTSGQYGLSALQDQQVAGLLMWVGSLPLAVLVAGSVLGRLYARLAPRPSS